MKRRILKARIKFISLVPKGANRMPVILKDDGCFSLDVLTKFSNGELLGLVYSPEIRDSQGDIASVEVIREMAHLFSKEGKGIDIRHDQKALAKDRAFVAESFIVQEGDPRFTGFQDLTGASVEAAGSWGVVIKIEDQDLRSKFESGEFNGLSMGGHAHVVAEKQEEENDMGVTLEDLNKANEPVIAALTALSVAISKTMDKDKDDMSDLSDEEKKKKMRDKKKNPFGGKKAPAFKGDYTDVGALKKHALEVQAFKLREDLDWTDPEAIQKYAEIMQKAQEDAKLTETPAEKIERLEKENLSLRLHGKQPSNQGAGAGSQNLGGGHKPTDADYAAIGKEMAEMAGATRGSKQVSLGGVVIPV